MTRRAHKEPVTEAVYRHVRNRDGWVCVGPMVPLAPRALEPCRGEIQLDHVHGAGLGKRGPSTPANLVSLCGEVHHPAKTENAREWRKHLDWYIKRFEPTAAQDA